MIKYNKRILIEMQIKMIITVDTRRKYTWRCKDLGENQYFKDVIKHANDIVTETTVIH